MLKKPWITSEIIALVKQKNKCYEEALKGDPKAILNYKLL